MAAAGRLVGVDYIDFVQHPGALLHAGGSSSLAAPPRAQMNAEMDADLEDIFDVLPSRRSARHANVLRRKPQYEVSAVHMAFFWFVSTLPMRRPATHAVRL